MESKCLQCGRAVGCLKDSNPSNLPGESVTSFSEDRLLLRCWVSNSRHFQFELLPSTKTMNILYTFI